MQNAFTKRAFIAGLILSALIAFYDHMSGDILNGSYMAIDHMPVAAIMILFLIIFLNALVKRIKWSLGFSSGELLLIYSMMLVACSVTEMGFGSQILPILAAPKYYANPNNDWTNRILSHINKDLVVTDTQAVTQFFEGLPQGGKIPWGLWIKPLSLWIPFILVLYFCMICVVVLLRKQWMEREKLVYPLTQLPLEMVQEEQAATTRRHFLSSFFKSPYMWIGFAIAFISGTLVGLHHHWPIIPAPRLANSIQIFRGTQNLNFRISFPVIGFVYLANLEVSFSLWFFNLIFQIIRGVFNMTGISSTENIGIYGCAGYAIFAHLGTGAMIAMVAYSFYISRAHMRDIWRVAIGRLKIDDSQEMLPYRTAFWGLVIGSVFVLGWLKFSGLTWHIGILFYLFAMILYLVLTRIVCEAGIPTMVATIISSSIIVSMWGSKNLTPAVLVALALTYVYAADLRTFPMASSAMAVKVMDRTKGNRRILFWAIFLAIAVNIIATMYFVLKISYKYGGINLNGWFNIGGAQAPYDYVGDLIKNQTEPNKIGWLCRGIGLVLMGLLMFLRQQFLWWPLHPIGFVIAPVWLMDFLWFSIFVAWLVKKIILKYGGVKTYEKSKYFFLGLPLGLYTCAGIWVFIDWFSKPQHHGNCIFWI